MAEKNIGPVGQVFLASLLLGLCLLGPLFGFSERTTELTSSETCQKCHAEIYRHWKNAMHSMSLEDPIFKSAYIESYFNTRGQAKYNSLRCHAPAVLVKGDYDLEQANTKEGVSCDFCHSVKAIHFEKRDHPFELEIGRIKRGPLSEASSPAHETKASPLFKSSELCAGCHEYVNDNGVSILGTYTEWKSGPYAKQGIPCQDCHMPLVSGNIVRPQVAASQQKKINLHAISASHSTEQLQKAVAVRIQNVHREEGVIQVTVEVSNTGSGHKVPTGIPSRKLVLLVELKAPNVYLTQHKTYERRLL
ncbi:MAG: multiheme c-type cytochrome, partial [Candidatus Aminicenantales bacterium]